MVFKAFGFLVFKKPRKVDFFGFYGFLDISFSYKFCAQTMRILFFNYNFIFNLREFTFPLATATKFYFSFTLLHTVHFV